MEFSKIEKEMLDLMEKALTHTLHEFDNIHTGKATPAMVENIQVHIEAYGTTMPINQIAAVSTPDTRTIQIQPWDKTTAGPIEKAIRTADLGFNPVTRGAGIIVPVPELSGDRRKELVKVASGYAEDGRVSVRQARHHAMEGLKKMKTDGHISEDDIKRYEKDVQAATDKYIEQINEALKAKEEDLLRV